MTQKVTELKLTEQQLYLDYSLSYGINLKDRVVRITDEIDQWTVDVVDTALSEMERESGKPITVKISSPGGDVYSAFAVVDRLRSSKCYIHTVGLGQVFSAATLILTCGDAGHRKLGARSFIMHHESSFGVEGRFSDVKEQVEQVEKEERLWAEAMYEFSNYGSAQFWLDIGKKRDWYLNAKEAVTYGIVDKVIG